jgi:hypothetical protein
MPAQTLAVGPLEVRRGDLAVIAKTRLEVIDMTVTGSTGKMLRFDDGTTLQLRLGEALLVHRPTAPRPGAAHTPGMGRYV